MESEAYESVGNVTHIEKEEHVASPPPISYYLGSGIHRNRKNAQKTIPTCGGVKKNHRTQHLCFHRFADNFRLYHTVPAEPTRNSMPEASRETQKTRVDDPSCIADVVN
ncbi:unnamed protein product [Lactuca virosa]|uniref:Uncharacterized protein n=1 Tax=Lactuca virosa TaxID=75947 RepID=A0AAU9N809_9ASTR|nr:unnamed protein product [Lactuca virosa]